MNPSRLLLALTASSLTFLFACTATIAPLEGGGGDAAVDAQAAGDGGPCCPPDPTPGCCMHQGGWSWAAGSCGMICDGIPVASDPSWKIVDDDHGCPAWTYSPGGVLCGSPPPDGGQDANEGAAANDPRCPATFSFSNCMGACSPVGLSCFYPALGSAMFCRGTSDGGTDAGAGAWICGI